MVLAPSQNLNIFSMEREQHTKNESPSPDFFKLQQNNTDINGISKPGISAIPVEEKDENKNDTKTDIIVGESGGDRFYSETNLLTIQTDETQRFCAKRHFSTDSLNVWLEEENNNVDRPTTRQSKSWNNLYMPDKITNKYPPSLPQVHQKPLKRRFSNLFSSKLSTTSASAENLTPAIRIENTKGEATFLQQCNNSPGTPKARTPGLFRKFGKSVQSIPEMSRMQCNGEERELPKEYKPSLDSHTIQDGRTAATVRKSRSFSLQSDISHRNNNNSNANGNTLKVLGQKSFPSLRRSPFSKTKFDHSAANVDDVKRQVYNEMLKSIQENDCKKLKLLIKRRKTDVNTLEYKLPLIHEAAFKGCEKCTRALIKMGWSVELSDKLGWKPLHAAVIGGSLETVKAILNSGAFVDTVTVEGLTPLHLAVRRGDLYVTHELLRHGSNPLLSTNYHDTPFQSSINLKQTLILDYFLFQDCFLVDNNDSSK